MINLKIERVRKRMTQAELAEKVGVNTFMIGRYEAGETAPRADVLKKMAEVLDTTMDILMENAEDDEVKEAE